MYDEADGEIMDADKGGYRQINKTLNICAFEDYLKGQSANLPDIPSVEQLSSRVIRVLGQNPGKFTLQGTNTYIIGTGSSRIIIDTSGGESEWTDLISNMLTLRGIHLSHILLTHFHGDHTGGVPDLVRMYPHLENNVYKNEPENNQQNIVDGQVFKVEGATVRALHVPGHSTDHMCFILEEEQAMFTGDNILGHGTSAIEDLAIFMGSLQRMLRQHCRIGYPAHGVVITDLGKKINVDLSNKVRRERRVLQALKYSHGRGVKSVTTRDIVTEIHGERLDESTRSLALEPFMDEVLRKLASDGKVGFEIRSGNKLWYAVKQMVSHQRSYIKPPEAVKVSVTAIAI